MIGSLRDACVATMTAFFTNGVGNAAEKLSFEWGNGWFTHVEREKWINY